MLLALLLGVAKLPLLTVVAVPIAAVFMAVSSLVFAFAVTCRAACRKLSLLSTVNTATCHSHSCRNHPTNPRRRFDERALEELAASVRSQGVLQPLLVRPLDGTPTRLLDANFKSILFAHIYLNIRWLPFFNVGNVKVSV